MILDESSLNVGQSNSLDSSDADDEQSLDTQSLHRHFIGHQGVYVEFACTIISKEVVRQVSELKPEQIDKIPEDLSAELFLEVGRELVPRTINAKTMHVGLDYKMVAETVASKLRMKLAVLFSATMQALPDMGPIA